MRGRNNPLKTTGRSYPNPAATKAMIMRNEQEQYHEKVFNRFGVLQNPRHAFDFSLDLTQIITPDQWAALSSASSYGKILSAEPKIDRVRLRVINETRSSFHAFVAWSYIQSTQSSSYPNGAFQDSYTPDKALQKEYLKIYQELVYVVGSLGSNIPSGWYVEPTKYAKAINPRASWWLSPKDQLLLVQHQQEIADQVKSPMLNKFIKLLDLRKTLKLLSLSIFRVLPFAIITDCIIFLPSWVQISFTFDCSILINTLTAATRFTTS